jgi:Na+/glutamate symporter
MDNNINNSPQTPRNLVVPLVGMAFFANVFYIIILKYLLIKNFTKRQIFP